jgi:hypothetical protein
MKIAEGPPLFRRPRDIPLSREGAETLALQALAFLAGDVERGGRFLSLTGVDPGDLRTLAREPGFLLAVLDHLAANEALLLEFAQGEALAPERVMLARRWLGGGEE